MITLRTGKAYTEYVFSPEKRKSEDAQQTNTIFGGEEKSTEYEISAGN
jgi:hypothetical protein